MVGFSSFVTPLPLVFVYIVQFDGWNTWVWKFRQSSMIRAFFENASWHVLDENIAPRCFLFFLFRTYFCVLLFWVISFIYSSFLMVVFIKTIFVLDIPLTFETDSLSVPIMWMPFGKRLLLYMPFTSAVEEGSEQACVIFFIYFMSLLAVITWDDCACFILTMFINWFYWGAWSPIKKCLC